MPEEEKVYCSMYSRNSELYHHGIKGQKWGVRNGPPYPLGSDVSTGSRLKKTIKRKEKKIEKIEKKQHKIVKEQNTLSKKNVKLESKKEKTKKFLEKYQNKVLPRAGSDAVETALVIASPFIATLIAALGVKFSQDLTIKEEINKNIKESEKDGSLKKKNKATTISQDAKIINPNFSIDKKWQFNCALCSAAYDMRRRGYDVQANPSEFGRTMKEQARMYNMSEKEISKTKSYTAFKKDLESMPNGSRGIIHINAGDFGSLHALAWEKQNNKIKIIDAQDGDVMPLEKAVSTNLINKTLTNEYRYFRTDDKDFNEKYIRDAVHNRR